MLKAVIIGNSGAARECYWLLQDVLNFAPGFKSLYSFYGFLSWKGHSGDLRKLTDFFRGDADDHQIRDDEQFIIGIGEPSLRRAVYEEFKARGAHFMNLIHPWADISSAAEIGEANIFQRLSSVFCDAVVGNGNYLNGAVNIAHDARIGDFNFLGPVALLLGGSSLGSENMLGASCGLLPGARVGNGNLIAPGSFVYKGCGDNSRLAGNPARNLGPARDGDHA